MFSRFGLFAPPTSYYPDSDESDDELKPKPTAGPSGPESEAHRRLTNMLSTDAEVKDAPSPMGLDEEEIDDHEAELVAAEGMCVECGDQPASLFCEQCSDDFCDVCYQALHKKGTRRKHVTKQIAAPVGSSGSEMKVDGQPEVVAAPTAGASSAVSSRREEQEELKNWATEKTTSNFNPDDPNAASLPVPGSAFGTWFLDRAKYVPLRLTMKERKKLRLVEATLEVSEYTDKVDIISYRNKAGRIHAQLKEVCAILSGLMVASDYKTGQQLVRDFEFKDNATFFQDMFEIGRRHKIRNPEKMRSAYGKLVYLLQDSVHPEIQDMLEFRLTRRIKTVYSLLEDKGALACLQDALLPTATCYVDPFGKTRGQIDREIRAKDKAVAALARKYCNPSAGLSEDDVRTAVLSINDNHNYLINNRDPCDRMIAYLKQYFNPDGPKDGYSLAIMSGRGGARLTHPHRQQYAYVLQSLTLWREILHDMFRLWYLTEEDLLDETTPYRLRNTGQGMNRVQYAPLVGRAIGGIIRRVQNSVGSWVGSSVVHLGDHNVPNALMFIDKYNQVPRILGPIVLTLRKLDSMYEKPDLKLYIDNTFGGLERCRLAILTDFFRHAFDGSGADNFFDAGSCIDGRLTSAWNWCSKIEKKSFYHIFVLAGFQGFDGKF